jgi:hypothetical protein
MTTAAIFFIRPPPSSVADLELHREDLGVGRCLRLALLLLGLRSRHLGDRLTDETGEYEVIGRPYHDERREGCPHPCQASR